MSLTVFSSDPNGLLQQFSHTASRLSNGEVWQHVDGEFSPSFWSSYMGDGWFRAVVGPGRVTFCFRPRKSMGFRQDVYAGCHGELATLLSRRFAESIYRIEISGEPSESDKVG